VVDRAAFVDSDHWGDAEVLSEEVFWDVTFFTIGCSFFFLALQGFFAPLEGKGSAGSRLVCGDGTLYLGASFCGVEWLVGKGG
jgi:hypothetical protein